jgi:5S rRNA maturation endonuclease (ribonuclease M5)
MPDSNEIWTEYKKTVLSKLTPSDVYPHIKNQKNGSGGWVTGLCPFHKDSENSFAYNKNTLQFCCFAGCGKGSVFDFLMYESGQDFKATMLEIGHKVGVPDPITPHSSKKKPAKTPINEDDVKMWAKYLDASKEVLLYLNEKKGISKKTIKKYEIGWDPKRERNTIPIRDERGNCVNIRFYNAKKKPKIINLSGHGSPARLYGLDELVKSKEKQIIICEGEFDRLILCQEGFMAVTGTHGCSTFRQEWVNSFENKDVIIIYDCDSEGKKAANNFPLKAFQNSKINSIKNITLPLKGSKDDKDISDYFHGRGFTKKDLQKLINNTPPHKYTKEKKEEKSILLKCFTEIEQKKYIDKKIECDITVSGQTSEAFHAVEKFDVTYCAKMDKGECLECSQSIEIPPSSQEYIGSCMTSNYYVKSMLQDFCCRWGKKPSGIEILERTTVKEFFCTQVANRLNKNNELMEKRVYYISSNHPKPGHYHAVGWVKSHPKTQQVTLLITELTAQKDDYEGFSLSDNIKHLQEFQKFSLSEIIEHLSSEVIKIHERDDILIAILFAYCSPRWLTFNNEKIRGWLVITIIGDAGTGKSQTYKNLINYIGVGDCFSGLTGSRTGLAYALAEHKQKGWQLRIGRYPANTRKILIVDEAHKVPPEDIRTISIAMEDGEFRIDRVASKTFESQTRLIMIANPDKDKTMDGFSFGCRSLKSVFPPTIIRRTDLALFPNSSDIKDKSKINREYRKLKPKITPEMLRAAIYWVWNLEPEQIEFTQDATKYCLKRCGELSNKYGWAVDVPLIKMEDARLKLARISAALAGLLVSSNKEYSKLIIEKSHVKIAADIMDGIYSHENCMLDDHSEIKRKENEIDDYDEIAARFMKKVEDS